MVAIVPTSQENQGTGGCREEHLCFSFMFLPQTTVKQTFAIIFSSPIVPDIADTFYSSALEFQRGQHPEIIFLPCLQGSTIERAFCEIWKVEVIF